MDPKYYGQSMSKEELERIAIEQAKGMQNAWPACEDGRIAGQQNMNAWAHIACPMTPPEKRPRWRRLMDWLKAEWLKA